MGGLDFFCTTIESPDGEEELLLMAMDAMNAARNRQQGSNPRRAPPSSMG